MKPREFVYTDPCRDDFAGTHIVTRPLPENYSYFRDGIFRRAWTFFLYRLLATPAVTLWQKLYYGERIKGREKLRPYRKSGYFLYGNHTRAAGDAFTPTDVTFPKAAYIVTHPDSASGWFLRNITADLGSVPLPTDLHGLRKFHAAVTEHSKRGHVVVIYPEAHIWPWYTKIRPFPDASFRYPAENGKPVFTFTTVYRKRKIGKRPRTVVYVDGPFFPEEGKSLRENAAALREAAYAAMTSRAAASDFSFHTYRQGTETTQGAF